MEYSDELVERYQEFHKKKSGEDVSREAANENLSSLVGFFDILWQMDIKDKKREEKLKEFPKGYAFMDGQRYSCSLCGMSVQDEGLWYDKWGIKCLLCQKAVDRKIIPGSLCKNHDSRYSVWEFEHYFKLSAPNVRKLVKEGLLTARIVPTEKGRPHVRVFLMKDNKGVLPPKNLLKTMHVPLGDRSFRVVQWYDFQEPADLLKDYKLLSYLDELRQYCTDRPLKSYKPIENP
jgi:hypothetical protein